MALDVIDLRSFSNLEVLDRARHALVVGQPWVLGVPHDMIQRARREGGQAQTDVEDLARININRLMHVVDSGAWLLGGPGGVLVDLAADAGLLV